MNVYFCCLLESNIEKMIEIKGKDGAIQIERKFEEADNIIKYTFGYKNDDIDFIYEEMNDDDYSLINFEFHLEELLMSNPYADLAKTLCKNPDAELKKRLRWTRKAQKIVDFFRKKSARRVWDSCYWFTYDSFLNFEIKMVENLQII